MKKKTKFKKDIMAVLNDVLQNQIFIMNVLSNSKEFENQRRVLMQGIVSTNNAIKINIAPWLNYETELDKNDD